MRSAHLRTWASAAVLVGVLYAMVGVTFALPRAHVQLWRLAAWAVSAMAFAAHIGYELLCLEHRPRSVAAHVATAVALGAFGLAIAANVHGLSAPSEEQHRRLLLIALVVWPAITGLPAFLVAWSASALLRYLLRTEPAQ